MFRDPMFIVAVLAINVVLSEWLVRYTFFKHFGTALLVIVVTAVTANLGLIPTSASETGVYDGVFSYVAPLAIFWLLLQVNLRDVLKAGFPMLTAFSIGAIGTALGLVTAMWLLNGEEAIGENYHAIGGMFVGTYTGGSVNFNALALEYDVMRDGPLYAGATAVDNIVTALWMIATIALPRLLSGVWPRRTIGGAGASAAIMHVDDDVERDTETVHPIDLGLLVAVGAGAIWLSDQLEAALEGTAFPVSSVLILTTMALAMAQIPAVHRLRGARLLGMFAVYLFLAVIGAFCDLAALQGIGQLGVTLLAIVAVTVAIHGVIVFLAGALLRLDVDTVAVASQANIGGATSALALARSLGRPDLVVPGILVGSLGYGAGTYLGKLVGSYIL